MCTFFPAGPWSCRLIIAKALATVVGTKSAGNSYVKYLITVGGKLVRVYGYRVHVVNG